MAGRGLVNSLLLYLVGLLTFMGWACGSELGRQADEAEVAETDEAVAFFRSMRDVGGVMPETILLGLATLASIALCVGPLR